MSITIRDVEVLDLRFPTSLTLAGSDALNKDPDYSATYVILKTDSPDGLEGHGLAFTNGRGNEICVCAAQAYKHLIVGRRLDSITSDFALFWRELACETQLRWLGPEKGIIHMAMAAIVNAIWDLYAKSENKPLWKLLADMSPRELVSCIDFRYITDALTPDEAVSILEKNESTKTKREALLLHDGYPAYTTSVAWLGYSDDKVRALCRQALAEGWTQFKMKVGGDLKDDIRRAALIRNEIGTNNKLMMDANQRWDVGEAIVAMKALAEFDPWWIEEPTNPDDVLGHATIARAIHPIGIATGENCANRILFKQFMQAGALQFCQIDSCRLGGVNENLAVILLAAKFNIPVCPHAGGVGLCEYVQHLSMFDYIAVSATLENRVTEFVDHLHEHFVNPVVIRNAHYMPPSQPGYSITIKPESRVTHRFPDGAVWKQMTGK
jgi:L-fuconate dehydratase